ncbi:MAG: HNH endonuclease [Thermoplasmata archaeon]|nr:HNH endonuclease [Thermoplasmata archaeon]
MSFEFLSIKTLLSHVSGVMNGTEKRAKKNKTIPIADIDIPVYKQGGVWYIDKNKFDKALERHRKIIDYLKKAGNNPFEAEMIITDFGKEGIRFALNFTKKKFARLISSSRSKARKLVLQRDGGKCVVCGRRDNLEVHHIFGGIYEKDYYVFLAINFYLRLSDIQDAIKREIKIWDDPLNLVTLCKDCHRALDPLLIRSSERKRYEKLILGEYHPRKQPKEIRVAKAIRDHMNKIYGEDYQRKVKEHLSRLTLTYKEW